MKRRRLVSVHETFTSQVKRQKSKGIGESKSRGTWDEDRGCEFTWRVLLRMTTGLTVYVIWQETGIQRTSTNLSTVSTVRNLKRPLKGRLRSQWRIEEKRR